MNCNVSLIRISIDSPDEDTFYKIRGESVAKIKKNIRNLTNKRKSKQKADLIVCIDMTLMVENIKQIEEMIDFSIDTGVDFLHIRSLNLLRENI